MGEIKGIMNVNVGIDIGSTTVKIVVVRDGEIIHKHYERHFSKVREKAVELVRAARELIGTDTPLRCSITGSAGLGVAKAADIDFVQEVFATRKAVGVHVPQADVVIELGGEDAKIVFLTGQLEERMNGSCAGGTGAFIDQMAVLLDVTPSELDELAQGAERIYTIASAAAYLPSRISSRCSTRARARRTLPRPSFRRSSTRPLPVWHRAARSRAMCCSSAARCFSSSVCRSSFRRR